MTDSTDKTPVILHLSDLHFGWKGDQAREADRGLALDGLFRCLKKLEPEWRPTHLAVTGDLGWFGYEAEYQEARVWLKQLMDLGGLGPEAVFFCPGNHDSIRSLAQKNRRPRSAAQADRVLTGPEIPVHYQKPFEKFSAFCRDLGLPPYRLAGRENYLCGRRDHQGLRVTAVNSAWLAKNKQDKTRLWLGLPWIEQMARDGILPHPEDLPLAPPTIVLMHHPQDWLHEAELQARNNRPSPWDFLARRCHLLLTGHTHGPVRRADRIAEGAWHLTGGAAFAGAGHFNNFRLIRLEENRFRYRAYEFDPRDADQVWSLKIESEPLTFQEAPPLKLTLELRAPQADEPPSSWLRPESQFVPLFGRDKEMKDLAAWRDRPDRFRWKVLIGQGGLGKTRLAQEFALNSEKLNWAAGFLDRGGLESLISHPGFDRWVPARPTLVLVDYAAGKLDLLKKFLTRCAEWAWAIQDGAKTSGLRVLLLERAADPGQGWVQELHHLEGVRGRDLAAAGDPVLELEPPAAEKEGLAPNLVRIIRAALDRWAGLTGQKAPDWPTPAEPDLRLLALNTGGRPLYLQMAALKACFEGRAEYLVQWRREDLVKDATDRERKYLQRLFAQGDSPPGLVDLVERAAALLGLTGPWPMDDPAWLKLLKEEATDLGYPNLPPGLVVESLGRVLIHEDQAGPTVLSPIRPDLLASAFTAKILNEKPKTRPLTLTRVLDLAGPEVWTRLVRLAQDLFGLAEFPVQDWIAPLVRGRPARELLAAERQMPVQNPALARWGAEVCRSLLSQLSKSPEADDERARLFNNQGGYLSTGGRREKALDAAARAVSIYDRLAAANPAAYEPALAASLNNLGNRYNDLGRRAEALAAAKRAVSIRERLAAAEPAAYEPDLAASLNNLGGCCSALGRRAEALVVAKKAVSIYERLASANPAAYEPDLAMSLSNLGSFYSDLGRRAEALAAAQRAVSIYDRLAAANPAAYEPALAASLNNLGNRYNDLGRRAEALAAAKRAVSIRERLAAAEPAAYEPDLAASLNNLGGCCSALGRRAEALAAAKRAVSIHERLAGANPAAYEPDLAMSLSNLGSFYSDLGRRAEALAAAQRAVSIHERLAGANPAAYEPDLAMSLSNLGSFYSDLGRRAEALAAAQRAVSIRERLAAAEPAAYEPDLAMSLSNLGGCCSALGRRAEALAAAQRAVSIRERLAGANPAAYEPDLAMSLSNLGSFYSDLGRRAEALAAAQRAVSIHERLAGANPAAYEPDLAMSLSNLGSFYSDLGRRAEALAAAQRAVSIRERLAAAEPAAYEPDLAMSLNNLGSFYSDLGRRAEALAAAERAVSIRERLAGANPAAYEPDLAGSLNNLGSFYSELGRREEALAAAKRAVSIYERLASADPAAYEPDLAMSLNNLGSFYSELGRREEALAAAKRAVSIYERLASADPAAYEPDLAMSLNNLGSFYSELGRREEALAAAKRAVSIYERLASADPAAYEPDLAMSLNNLGLFYRNLGRREEALVMAARAVSIYEGLAAANPAAYEQGLAMSLNNLGNLYSDLDRRAEALAAAERAVSIYEGLAAANPAAYEPALASSYGAKGSIFRAAQQYKEAAGSFLEGLRHLTSHFRQYPQAFLSLALDLDRDYLNACKAAGLDPDQEALRPIVETLEALKAGQKPSGEED